MINLAGKNALMLGGMHMLTGGIARRLQDAGAQITFAHKHEDASRAQTLATQINADAQPISFLDPESIKSEITLLGQIDIAVIATSWMAFGAFLDTTPADWDEVLAHNFEQAVYTSQAVAHRMIEQGGGGRIIFLSSVTALMPTVTRSAVGTSLAALHALAKMAAVDLAPHGITVNVLAVGWVEAEWTAKFLTKEGRANVEAGIPAARISQPEEVGDVCCFLASDLAAYITGAIIPVDGGYLLTKTDAKSPFAD